MTRRVKVLIAFANCVAGILNLISLAISPSAGYSDLGSTLTQFSAFSNFAVTLLICADILVSKE
jgi:hypothetical protein